MARILVIDDDEAVRQAVRKVAEGAGHQVKEAPDGRAGLHAYREDPADLVFVDLFMPEMDGLEFIQEFRTEFPGAKAVAMSGGGGPATMAPLEVAGKLGVATLKKPFDADEILLALDEQLDNGP